MAAQSLQRVRELLGEDLADQVEQISRELSIETEEACERILMFLDNRKLRGIPAVGRGVSGHIAGTDPLEALMAKCEAEEAA